VTVASAAAAGTNSAGSGNSKTAASETTPSAAAAPPPPPPPLPAGPGKKNRIASKAVLSALSFEKPLSLFQHHSSHHHQQRKHDTAGSHQPQQPAVVPPSTPSVASAVVQRTSFSSHGGGGKVNINHIMHGTLDPDGGVEDVFYDAQEYGDAPMNRNEFKMSYQRESVVLSSIRSTKDVSAMLEDHDNNFHDSTTRDSVMLYPPPPSPPSELPLRFLRAGKGNPQQGLKRYEETLQWRKEQHVDTILRESSPYFELIKQHYPHFCHGHGKNGEPCYYEQPPKTDLKALRAGGCTLDALLHHYTMVTEFQWQVLVRDDLQRSIYIIDLEGIRLGDFVGEVVDFVKRASALSAQHYPERAGCVFVINVPSWFRMIWSVLKPMVDEDTLKKIYILRGKEEIRQNMQERIDLDQIPADYGGTSVPLGQSEEEALFRDLIHHNNYMTEHGECCNGGSKANPPCRWCTWQAARSY